MPDLFGLDIASIVFDAIEAAGGLLPMTLTKVQPGTRNPLDLTAGTNPISTAYICSGVITDLTQQLIGDSLVSRRANEVLILGKSLPSGVVPAPGDRVTIEGTTYHVAEPVSRDPAAATYTMRVLGPGI